ncbi:efflux RND transporter periplasmic adaptor subunit [Psychrosphaera algicola]|uniref:Efflux RND transporter periplasmic adaptor subunit n=1 Tax=Psychrosphaera algicola TaxID=3023714 RepID=A0ABT5FAR0_9GAMM|nr:efflux RND transporter periplasmic adaptor subunit [Psychrosphaera sp. G1-22]MDC2888631.1 efflux RND transporter periplasmic adaptor subunit [Psychrosphaera sp. G1-22]
MNKLSFYNAMLFIAFMATSFTSTSASVPVKVDHIQEKSFQATVDVHGTIVGKRDVTLTSGISGRLEYVAEPGMLLHKGDIVAKFDLKPLKLSRSEQLLIIDRAQVNVDFQKIELARYQSLANTDATAQYQIDLTKNKLDLAKSNIDLARNKLEQIENQIERATIYAPFTGVVGIRFEKPGSEINRADKLVHLLDLTKQEVRLFLPIKYLNHAAIDQNVFLIGETLGANKATTGKVTSIIPQTDTRSQTFEIRALLLGADAAKWASGELVDVRVEFQDSTLVKLINRDALIIRKNGIHIVKIDENNKAVTIPVDTGSGHDEYIEIYPKLSDHELNEGDKIAIRGAERLTDGQEVDVQH